MSLLVLASWCFDVQVTERKSEFAKLESMDCGKPLDEAAWDIVCTCGTIVKTEVFQFIIYCL